MVVSIGETINLLEVCYDGGWGNFEGLLGFYFQLKSLSHKYYLSTPLMKR